MKITNEEVRKIARRALIETDAEEISFGSMCGYVQRTAKLQVHNAYVAAALMKKGAGFIIIDGWISRLNRRMFR